MREKNAEQNEAFPPQLKFVRFPEQEVARLFNGNEFILHSFGGIDLRGGGEPLSRLIKGKPAPQYLVPGI